MSQIIVLYRENDTESYDFALYYKQKHNLSDSSLLGIPCSLNEVVDSYDIFFNEIEYPIIDALNLSYEYNVDNISCIIVGFNVPGGFYDGTDIISTTSRLSRIYYEYSKKSDNPAFDQALYNNYNLENDNIIICSRIDAPTLLEAKQIVDNGLIVRRQSLANGKFYFDKISNYSTYQTLLDDFEEIVLPTLNMDVFKTYKWDDDTDVPLFRMKDDSIIWSVASNKIGFNYFLASNYSRIFSYNADIDSGFTLRNKAIKRFPLVSLLSGYATSAGAMSDPSESGFLSPTAFFNVILQGGSIGKAFLNSVPYLDWTVGLFGDPLITFKFPQGANKTDIVSNSRSLVNISENISSSIGFSYSRSKAFNDILTLVLGFTQNEQKIRLFNLLSNISGKSNSIQTTSYNQLIAAFLRMDQNFNTYLNDYNEKLSKVLLYTGLSNNIDVNNLYKTGECVLLNKLVRSGIGALKYHFEIELSLYEDFSIVFFSADSDSDLTNWLYEKTQDNFVEVASSGVGANYAGRYIKYKLPILLPKNMLFFARFRQKDNLGEYTDWIETIEVINT